MWYLFQEHHHLLKTTMTSNLEDDELEEMVTESEDPQRQHAERFADVKMTEYFCCKEKNLSRHPI